MSPEDMDSFIFCIASKRSAQRLSKEMNDLNTYCPEKRPADKYDIPGAYFVMSEVSCRQPCVSKFNYYWQGCGSASMRIRIQLFTSMRSRIRHFT